MDDDVIEQATGFVFDNAYNQSVRSVYFGMKDVVSPHGRCLIPQYPFSEVNKFLLNCTTEKFMNPDNPECSCNALNASFPDYVITLTKSGSMLGEFGGSGGASLYVFAAFVVAISFVVTLPLTLLISYRMSRREVQATKNGTFFMKWHRQKQSSFISLVLIVLGVILLFASVSGQSELDLAGILKITSVYPGLISLVLGFWIWLTTIRSSEKA
jgi:hypothetical protein